MERMSRQIFLGVWYNDTEERDVVDEVEPLRPFKETVVFADQGPVNKPTSNGSGSGKGKVAGSGNGTGKAGKAKDAKQKNKPAPLPKRYKFQRVRGITRRVPVDWNPGDPLPGTYDKPSP
jgi:hypothetical protein